TVSSFLLHRGTETRHSSRLFPYTTLFRSAYENLSEADKEALRLGKELQLRREEKAREEFSEELAPESLELAAGAEERQPESQSRSEEHTSELQSRFDLVCRLLLEKKNTTP